MPTLLVNQITARLGHIMDNLEDRKGKITIFCDSGIFEQILKYSMEVQNPSTSFSTYELVMLGLKSLESPWVKFSEQLPPASTDILVYSGIKMSSTSTNLQVVSSDFYAGIVLQLAIENGHYWSLINLPVDNGGDS